MPCPLRTSPLTRNSRASSEIGRSPRETGGSVGRVSEHTCRSPPFQKYPGLEGPNDQHRFRIAVLRPAPELCPTSIALKAIGPERILRILLPDRTAQQSQGLVILDRGIISPRRDMMCRGHHQMTGNKEVEQLKAEIERYKGLLQELHTSAERYRAIVDCSDDAIVSKDLNGIVTSWNPGAERIFGYTEAEMLGQPVRKLIPAEHQDEEDRILATIRKGGRVDHFETVRLHKDGSRLNISVTISPIRNERGQVVGASKVGRDITPRMREEELRNRLSAIVEFSEDAIIGKDLQGTITSWNKGAARIFGYTAEEAVGRSILMLIPQHMQGEETAILQRLRKGERIEHVQTRRLRKDGSMVDLSLTISPIRNEHGEIIGASKVARDISDEQRVTLQLKESEQKFTTMFQASPIGTLLAEMPSGRLLDANPAFAQLTGLSSEELLGRTAFQTGFQLAYEDQQDIIQELLRDGRLRAVEVDIRNRHGVRMSVVLNATLLNIAGQPCALLLVEDVTERRASEAALEETARRKDEFLATLAHELRNPLAPMANALQLLDLVPDDVAMSTQARAMMSRQMQQLVHLVDDLMDLSRVNRGVVELQRKPIDLRSAMVQALEATRPMADQRGHTLRIDQSAEPLWVSGDNTRLVQVFSNLLNNAAKYTDYGGLITISSQAREGVAVVEVCDNGTGIEPANLGRVFDMFAQLENATTRKQGGLGIGLSIVKQMVALHGGSISVASPGVGKGSTFTVSLPLGPPPAQEARQAPQEFEATRRLRVLVVDDNVESATTLSLLIRKMGHDARAVHNGQDGVVELATFKPDMVFLDIGMPGMDGYDTCRCMRAMPAGLSACMVALTGWGQDEDRRLADEAGFDRHIVKPIAAETLQTILASVSAAVTS